MATVSSILNSATRRVNVAVGSNNRIASACAFDRVQESSLNARLTSLNPDLKNMVLPNGAIIFVFEKDGQLHFLMHTDIVITDPKRLIDPNTFNALNLTAPIPAGFRKGTVFVLIRHEQGFHNLPLSDCEKYLKDHPEMIDQMLEKARTRNSQIDLSALDEQERFQLAVRTLCQDSSLTPKGRDDAVATATKLKALIDSSCLLPPKMTFLCSELQRTQETAGIVAAHFGHKGPIYAHAALNEINRQMQSPYWSLGMPQRVHAENSHATVYQLATSILKVQLAMSEQEWDQASPEVRKPFEDQVRAIRDENIPCNDGPTSFSGIPIVHRECTLPFDGDLIRALPRISNILHFCSGNKRKLLDFEGVFGKHLCMVSYEGDEAQGKPLYVAKSKATKMFHHLSASVLTEDVAVGRYDRESAADALIKFHVEEAAEDGVSLKKKLEERFGGAEFFSYRSSCVFTDGTRTFKTWAIARCTLKELTKEEKEGVVGDIDPFVVVHEIETWRQIDDNDPQPVGSITFDASDNLSIGQWQKVDPKNRSKLHPRYHALYQMKLELAQLGIMW